MSKLREFLKQQAQHVMPEPERSVRIERFRAALARLHRDVIGWTAAQLTVAPQRPSLRRGVAAAIETVYASTEEVDVFEPRLGAYAAPMLTLIIAVTLIVRLRPIGTVVIGGEGRVDLEGPDGSVKLGLLNDKWHVILGLRRPAVLKEESFLQALRIVLPKPRSDAFGPG
jgi:hypothetical protein